MTDAAAPPPPRSLLVRTTVVLGLTFVVLFGALVLAMRPMLAAAFEERSSEMMRDHAARFRDAARLTDSFAEEMLRARVAKAHRTGAAVVADAPNELVAGDPEKVRTLLAERLRRAEAEDSDAVAALAADLRTRSEELVAAETEEGAIRGRRDAVGFGDDLGWRAASALVGLVALLFLVHGALLWRSVIAPVARLSEATREVAKGRLEVRLPMQGDDEVGRLAANFNTMTESLERAQRELVALNATLEDRVREQSAALVQAERELRHAEKMASLGTLAGGVAHEFNNLLGGIQGCAEDAARETDPAELKETLGVIERTARRGAAITEKLLRFARPAAPGTDDVDVAAVARDVATLVQPEASRSAVEVTVEAPDEARIQADPTGVHQVMLNLATNAVHAMPRGGRLTIRVAREGEGVRIAVSDTGFGISAEDRAKLFEPFFTTRPEGTGLGLSVSYGIVKAHGGRIDVESSPGHGAVFTVTLPGVSPNHPAGSSV
jgi:signal transduction histidine kinase